MAPNQARSKIAQRGRDIGLDFDGEVGALGASADWEAELQRVQDPQLEYPSYYTQPFHAYKEGNLCWEAALQVCPSTCIYQRGCLAGSTSLSADLYRAHLETHLLLLQESANSSMHAHLVFPNMRGASVLTPVKQNSTIQVHCLRSGQRGSEGRARSGDGPHGAGAGPGGGRAAARQLQRAHGGPHAPRRRAARARRGGPRLRDRWRPACLGAYSGQQRVGLFPSVFSYGNGWFCSSDTAGRKTQGHPAIAYSNRTPLVRAVNGAGQGR